MESHVVYVLKAYDMNANGDLHIAFEPRQISSESAAVAEARSITSAHDGVAVWKQAVDPAVGDYGPETIIFKSGQIPEVG